jgi:hypothetical protein
MSDNNEALNSFGNNEEAELVADVDFFESNEEDNYWDRQVSYMGDGIYIDGIQLAEDLF